MDQAARVMGICTTMEQATPLAKLVVIHVKTAQGQAQHALLAMPLGGSTAQSAHVMATCTMMAAVLPVRRAATPATTAQQ